MKARSTKKITALIPCYNEAEGIADVITAFPLDKIKAQGFELEVVVIDNASTDGTAAIARAHDVTVLSEPKKGKGNAIRTGFNYISSDTDYVVMLDGDDTYRPEEILRLIEPLDSDFCTVVIGSRLGGRITDGSMNTLNRIGNWTFSHMVRYFYQVNVTDVLTGYFAWKRESLETLRPHLKSQGFAIEMEMITKMARLGEEMYCVPITYAARSGESSLDPVGDGLRILRVFLRNLFWNGPSAVPAYSSTDKKTIVIVSSYYPPHLGGLEIVAKNQAQRLAAVGNKVIVVTSRIDSNASRSMENGVEVIRVPALNISEQWGAPFPIFSPQIIPVLSKAIRNADVVHLHDAFYMSSFVAAICARWYKKPIVLMQHVAMINHPSNFVMFVQKVVYATTGRIILNLSNTIIVLNDRVRDFLAEQGGVQAEKIIAFNNGVDGDLFHPVSFEEKRSIRSDFGLSLEKKIILFVGRFVPKKGFHKVLAARSNEYQIVFAGGDAPEQNTEEVVFLGKLSQEKLAEIYQAADIFVLPSEDEGFPLSIQEAMASGLPIITQYDYGYAPYNFDREKMHFIDKATNASVRHAIQEILYDDDRLKKMSDYSHEYAREHFNWHMVISRLENIYEALA